MGIHLDPSLYIKNMGILEKRFPEFIRVIEHAPALPFDTVPFASGRRMMNLLCRQKGKEVVWYSSDDFVRSAINSTRAWELGGNDFLVCVGFGIGYKSLIAAAQFLKTPAQDRPEIVVFERFPAMFRLAMQLVDLRRLFSYERLQLFIGDIDVAKTMKSFSFGFFLGKQIVVGDGAYRELFKNRFLKFENEVYTHLSMTRDLWHTTAELGPTLLGNTIHNLPSLLSSQPVGKLKNALKNIPVVCIAAGPGLDEALPYLKKIGNRALLLAIDSAIPALISAGIRPHMVATADVNSCNIRKYRAYLHELKDAILIFAVESNPSNVSHFLGLRHISVSIDNPILDLWLTKKWGLECALPAMTTVTHAAVFTAMNLGCEPIVFAGMDMAFPGRRSHSKGAMHHYQIGDEKMITVEGVDGSPVLTYPPLNDYRIQLESVIAGKKERFINTSPNGARIAGTEEKSLKKLLDADWMDRKDIRQILDGIPWAVGCENEKAVKELNRMIAQVKKFIDACSKAQGRVNLKFNSIESLAETILSFKEKHLLLESILAGVQLKECRSIEREIRRQKFKKDGACPKKLKKIWQDLMRSKRLAGEHFLEQLYCVQQYFSKEVELMARKDKFEVAKFYTENNQLGKALATFATIRAKKNDPAEAWLKPIALVMDKKMLSEALHMVHQGIRYFPEDERFRDVLRQLQSNTDELYRNGVKAWESEKPLEANIHLLEYLAVFPQDTVAADLKQKINQEIVMR